MPLIEYPASLPPPIGFPFARREGRSLPQGAGNEPPRARMRDAIVDADTVRWRYSPAEMAIWRAWFEDTLLNGQLWFAATLPGRGGWLPRVARYIGEQLQLTHLGAGFWEVSCRLELRGLSAAPRSYEAPEPAPVPVLLMHFDDDFVDETGNTTFTPSGSYGFVDAAAPAFGRSVVGVSVARAAGASGIDMSIGSQPYTIEGRSLFTPTDSGGYVLVKNYHSTQPGPGVFKNDYAVRVTPTRIEIGWTGQTLGIEATFSAIVNEEFVWSISDDGEFCYLHLNGILLETFPAAALDPVPPPVTPSSSISVLNGLQGFSGPSPNWGGSFYEGRLDELRMFIGTALYGAENYTPSAVPFSLA